MLPLPHKQKRELLGHGNSLSRTAYKKFGFIHENGNFIRSSAVCADNTRHGTKNAAADTSALQLMTRHTTFSICSRQKGVNNITVRYCGVLDGANNQEFALGSLINEKNSAAKSRLRI